MFAALAGHAGVIAHRPGALEGVQLLECWDLTHERISQAELRMTAVLDELGLTSLVTLDHRDLRHRRGGDPGRDWWPAPVRHRSRPLKHAGLAPREKLSGEFTGRTRLTGQGRPGLRLAAWRAVWGGQRANPVYGARYQYLTSREHNKLTPTQAQTVIAAAIMRQLHAVITSGQAWDPLTAAHGTRRQTSARAA